MDDTIAVIWLFYTFDSFIKISKYKLLIIVLLISYLIEFAQYFHILIILGLKHNRLFNIVLGSTFDIKDLLAYCLGAFIILIVLKRVN